MIASDQLLTAAISAAVPSFTVLIGILVNNHRLNDLNRRLDDLIRSIDIRFNEVNRRIDDTKEVLRAEMFRIEQVLDARLKHLEDHR